MKVQIEQIEIVARVQCPTCGGKKKVAKAACKQCGGKGTVTKHLSLEDLQELLVKP